MLKRIFTLFVFIVSIATTSHAQIEGAFVKTKDYQALGFGAFLNFAFPVSEANYLTVEGGLKYFKNSDDDQLGAFPVLLGYRYTLDQTGAGFYVEPYAGYTFGGTDFGEDIAGPTAGMGFGYLFQPLGKIQFNLALRYDHTFGNTGMNMIALRLTHSFTFGRHDE